MAHGIDFSKLDRIAYQDFDTEEKREERDSLLQAGYTFVDSPENPFTAPQTSAPPEPQPEPPQPERAAPERKREAFTDHSGSRDYNRYYRIAHDYHKAHTPPVVEAEYWRTHTPGEDDIPEAEAQYWIRAAAELGAASESGGNDLFLMDLLSALYAEIEREYKALREEAHRGA